MENRWHTKIGGGGILDRLLKFSANLLAQKIQNKNPARINKLVNLKHRSIDMIK